jgi:fucose permease
MIGFALYVGMEAGIGGWMPSQLESVGLQSVAAATLTSGFWLALAAGRLLAALVPARVPESAIVITASAVAAVALVSALIPAAAPVAYIVAGLAIAPVFPTGIVWLAKLRPGDARITSWLFPASMVGGAVIPGGIGAVIARFGIGVAPAVLSLVAVGCVASFSLASRGGAQGIVGEP